jgi:hypothetical protein
MGTEKMWLDDAGDDEPGPEHPAGEIRLAPRGRYGLRAALLSGLTTAVTAGIGITAMLEPGTTGHTSSG